MASYVNDLIGYEIESRNQQEKWARYQYMRQFPTETRDRIWREGYEHGRFLEQGLRRKNPPRDWFKLFMFGAALLAALAIFSLSTQRAGLQERGPKGLSQCVSV